MSHPQIVTITFADDTARPALEAYSQWMVQSQWLTAAGAEYGVGTGSVLGVVERADNAPSRITDDELVTMLSQGLADGSFPQPANRDLSNVLYVVHLGPNTMIDIGTTDHPVTSCVQFLAYHASARRNGFEFSYAVVADCPAALDTFSELQGRELATSHEFIEAATDPLPGANTGFRLQGSANPWSITGGEVADLCALSEGTDPWVEGDFIAQRSWSNQAAAHHLDPCVPSLTHSVYYNVVPTPSGPQHVPAGGSIHYDLRGWATGQIGDWNLTVLPQRSFTPSITVSHAIMNEGRTSTLDVTIPAGTPTGSYLLFLVSAFSPAEFRAWPLVLDVGGPCSSLTDCTACATAFGCGWCAASNRCETAGDTGSADSSCAAADWLTAATACNGGCASHGASCAECAVQPGCGWCATSAGSHCVAANDTGISSRDGTCSGAAWSPYPTYCP